MNGARASLPNDVRLVPDLFERVSDRLGSHTVLVVGDDDTLIRDSGSHFACGYRLT